MNIKLILALIATLLSIIAYIPYLRDILARKTKPHLFTWLIWVITQGTATAALLYGGGGFSVLVLTTDTILVFLIFLLSFKYGTKDISWSDWLVLTLSFLSIVVWWQLNSPLLAVLMVSAIDSIAYIPTLRKSFKNPWNETMSFWVIMAIAGAVAIAANTNYNLLTVVYLATILTADLILISFCFIRRGMISRATPN